MRLRYNSLFDNVAVEDFNREVLNKDKLPDILDIGLSENDIVTLNDLEEEFNISRYNVNKILKEIEAKPVGELKNKVNGKNLKGVGKKVYKKDIVDAIYEYFEGEEDSEDSVSSIKAMAEGYLNNDS